nr:hypothetical protein [Caldisericia bacterium]
QTNQISDLSAMKSIPKDFIGTYEAIVNADSVDELKKLCHKMIYNTRKFLNAKKPCTKNRNYNKNFKDLANWYQELSYTWRRIYYWCDQNGKVKSFMWGCFLQSELDIVKEEFGLDEMDLLGKFSSKDLTVFHNHTEQLEKYIVGKIEEQGVILDKYDSVEDFIKKNS